MKNLFLFFTIIATKICLAVSFDSSAHFQMGTVNPEMTSYMRVSCNFYDYLPETDWVWVVSPKMYLNPSVPVDFSGSIGLKKPLGLITAGYHMFGHFHNLGDFPVNQYGHTLEILSDRIEGRINYYMPANGVYPFSDGILSNHRIDSEFTAKFPHGSITLGPVYLIKEKELGFLARITSVFDSVDFGVEIQMPPMQEPITSLFTTFKFPPKKFSYKSSGSRSSHYVPVTIRRHIDVNYERKDSKED